MQVLGFVHEEAFTDQEFSDVLFLFSFLSDLAGELLVFLFFAGNYLVTCINLMGYCERGEEMERD
jgi:hypothetical protein